MAKATRSQEVLTGTSDSYTEHELTDPNPPVVVTRAVLGGELLSVGNNSEVSTEKQSTISDEENQFLQSPAPTTDNPSSQPEEETDSNVTSTVGNGQSEPAKQSAKRTPARKTTARKANTRTLSEEDEF